MTPARIAVGLGIAFGFALAWSGMTDPDLIRRMLLLEDLYFFLVMFSSMAVAFPALRALRRRHVRALLTGEPVSWTTSRPARRHVVGSVLFGVGWATSLSCPGPVAAQLGQGLGWSLFTITGIGTGILVHTRIQRHRRTPAAAAVPWAP
jgi:uncharacterized membrane protein YedE/YeeE